MTAAPNGWRREFAAFPYEPYAIQIEFMSFLYDSLDRGGVSMLESPTGTGKTLSIICSALQWLVDRRRSSESKVAEGVRDGGDDEPDWVRDYVVDATVKKETRIRESPGRLKKSSPRITKVPVKLGKMDEMDNEDEEFIVDDYESEEDLSGGLKRKMQGFEDSGDSGDEEEDDEVSPKIYFTSRTHSQLSQFVKELKKTSFASEINFICLGSRKNLCVNPDVSKLRSSSQINERCLELHKSRKQSKTKTQCNTVRRRTSSSSRCPMLKRSLQKLFKNKVHENGTVDIEDLLKIGSRIGACPYYGSRDMVRAADLIALPYQSLLLKSARQALGLNLRNNVIIIDEAHNLADSLTAMYNAKITLSQLKQVHCYLQLYLDRFLNVLGPGNRRYIQTLLNLTQSFIQFLLGFDKKDAASSTFITSEKFSTLSMTINEFLFSLDIDNINLVKLHQFLKEGNIIQKVSGYGYKVTNSDRCPSDIDAKVHSLKETADSGFYALADILQSLINENSEGRIVISMQKEDGSDQLEDFHLKFVMLSGEQIFSEITSQTHAIILAGGTLQPIEETRMRLFPSISADQVQFFTCNHIVPPESILPVVISRGPSGMKFDFSYNSRSTPDMIEELGRLICNIVVVIPEGIVIFFSSFDYENQVHNSWKASGILSRILKRKHVFREPRSNIDVEVVLKDYKEAIMPSWESLKEDTGQRGALLLAVVGGKVSEGLNFSDGLGRCVIMVGLPYPSPSDFELMERIRHISGLRSTCHPRLTNNYMGRESYVSNSVQSGFEILRSCNPIGREYYDNLCMKAVNQSIGRAIRHINDYAAVLLVDSRYTPDSSHKNAFSPINKLPRWLRDCLVTSTESYGEVHRLLHQFFQAHKHRVVVNYSL